MLDAYTITSPSPDGLHTARFAIGGEIRFGPLYYVLSLDGYDFGQRIFGEAHLWSPTSNFLAVQEWLTTDYSEGPITALVLIDATRRREARIDQATKAFLIAETFAEPLLAYHSNYAGGAKREHFETDITTIADWQPFG